MNEPEVYTIPDGCMGLAGSPSEFERATRDLGGILDGLGTAEVFTSTDGKSELRIFQLAPGVRGVIGGKVAYYRIWSFPAGSEVHLTPRTDDAHR
jgi:hypothetical protein